jgi:peptide/nickel transport system substrate-binding protein
MVLRRCLRLIGPCAVGLALIAAPPAWAGRDQLTVGLSAFPASLHPDIDPVIAKAYVNGFVQRTITAFGPDGKNTCLLCTELPTLQNGLARLEDRPGGGHGMAVTIKLRPDLKWNDGVPVTARDLAFTWRVARDPNAGFSNPHPWIRASAVDVLDDHTAVLHLDHPLVSFDQWDQILPEHIEGPIYAKATSPGDYINTTAYDRLPTTPGLYDSPYEVTGYEAGSRIVLEPNPFWPGAKPGFKRIVLTVIENASALQANLLSGDIDLTVPRNGLSPAQTLAMKAAHPDQFTYLFTPSIEYAHLDVQTANPALADVRVRQALLLAIDRKTIIAKLTSGLDVIAATSVGPLEPGYDPSIPVVAYDPAAARALLQSAGWTPGPDGIRRNAAGDKLSFPLTAAAGNAANDRLFLVLQSAWKAIGVEVSIKTEALRTFGGTTLKHRAFEGLAYYTWSNRLTESPRRTLGSDQIPTAANNWGGANWANYADPAMDADIAASETELDPVRNKAIWSAMQRRYATSLPAIPLWFVTQPTVIPIWLKGYTPLGTGEMSSQWSEAWHPG